VHKADFERLLGSSRHWRSAHFAVHHVAVGPTRPQRRTSEAVAPELSTDCADFVPNPVDKLPGQHWLGVVVPKRHARRSVTRSLIKRQMRAAMTRHAVALPPGLWLLRLRQPFSTRDFPSAASEALARALRAELDQLLLRTGRSGVQRAAQGSVP